MEELAQIAATPQQIQLVIDPCIVLTQQQPFVHQVPVSKPAVKQLSSFLTRFHAGYFRISLSLAGQALLWKILSQLTSEARALKFVPRFFPYAAFLLVWYLALVVQIALSSLYALKCFLHFNTVRAEFLHHVGVNYLYTPWISWLLLLQSAPGIGPESNCYQTLWWVFAIPIGVLDIKIYGQWFTTDKRFLSVVANPTSQISVIGNLVGAGAAAQMGWIEIAVCMFSLGMVHYLVLFVTLYQHLSGVNRFPAMLRPVFSLFFAAPSMASLAWSSISGAFDTSSKMLFFLSLFLFTSSFPLTFLALASAAYAQESKGGVAPALMLVLSALSILVLLGLMISTAIKTNRLLLFEHHP